MKLETLAKKLALIGIEAAKKQLAIEGKPAYMTPWDRYQSHTKAGHIAVAKWHLAQMAKKNRRSK